MLQEVKKLHGLTLHALDGEVGRVDEILFDDEHWTVRYLIVDTGSWLFGRKVLISPLAFGTLNLELHTLNVNLTRKQIEDSPGFDTHQPISRQWEGDYYDYYAWPYYWGGMGGWGGYWYPGALFAQPVGYAETPQQRAADQARDHADTHLRSTKEVSGYAISATDGHVGHVQDFIVNDETWRISYLVMDLWDWWPGKKVLLPPEWIGEMNWPDKGVTVTVTRKQVQDAPEWIAGQEISRLYEDELYSYYGRQRPLDHERPGDAMSKPQEYATQKVSDSKFETNDLIRAI